MLRCAIYCRVSTEFDTQKGSLKNQEQLLRDYAKSEGWTVYDLYSDIHTATKGIRSEFDRMIKDALSGKFDIILSKDVSRLVRSFKIGYKLKELHDNNNIHIVTHDNFVNTINGDLRFFPLFIFFAELHSQELSDKIKGSTLVKAKRGEFVGSIPPYGYYKSSVDKKLHIKPDNTPEIVQRIYREYLSGKGFDSIAKDLTNDKIPSPRKSNKNGNSSMIWQGSTVRLILQNRHYCGDLLQNKTTTKNVTSTKRLNVDFNKQTLVENTHDAIISKEDFLLVQELINSRKKISVKQDTHLYSNLLFCADCGKGMHYIKSRKGYVCGTYNKQGVNMCSSHFIKEETITNILLLEISNIINSFSNISSNFGFSYENEITKISNKYNKLLNNIESKKNERKKLTHRFISGDIIKAAYEECYNDLCDEISLLEIKLDKYKFLLSKVDKHKVSSIISSNSKVPFSSNDITPELLHRLIIKIHISNTGIKNIEYTYAK